MYFECRIHFFNRKKPPKPLSVSTTNEHNSPHPKQTFSSNLPISRQPQPCSLVPPEMIDTKPGNSALPISNSDKHMLSPSPAKQVHVSLENNVNSALSLPSNEGETQLPPIPLSTKLAYSTRNSTLHNHFHSKVLPRHYLSVVKTSQEVQLRKHVSSVVKHILSVQAYPNTSEKSTAHNLQRVI